MCFYKIEFTRVSKDFQFRVSGSRNHQKRTALETCEEKTTKECSVLDVEEKPRTNVLGETITYPEGIYMLTLVQWDSNPLVKDNIFEVSFG